MKIAALLAIVVVAGSAAKIAEPRLDAYVLLGDGRIAKVNVASGRVVARRSLGRTPRVLPDHGPSAGTSVIALSRTTGRILHPWRFSAYVVAVAA